MSEGKRREQGISEGGEEASFSQRGVMLWKVQQWRDFRLGFVLLFCSGVIGFLAKVIFIFG